MNHKKGSSPDCDNNPCDIELYSAQINNCPTDGITWQRYSVLSDLFIHTSASVTKASEKGKNLIFSKKMIFRKKN